MMFLNALAILAIVSCMVCYGMLFSALNNTSSYELQFGMGAQIGSRLRITTVVLVVAILWLVFG